MAISDLQYDLYPSILNRDEGHNIREIVLALLLEALLGVIVILYQFGVMFELIYLRSGRDLELRQRLLLDDPIDQLRRTIKYQN